MPQHIAEERRVVRVTSPNHRPESRVTPVATVRGYEPRDLEACRGLWVELTQRHRDIFDAPEIGGDDSGSAFDEHLAKVSAETSSSWAWTSSSASATRGSPASGSPIETSD